MFGVGIDNYYHEQFEIRGSNTKNGWAFINFLTGQGIRTRRQFMINNKMISDNVIIVDSFNEYFVIIRKVLLRKLHLQLSRCHI